MQDELIWRQFVRSGFICGDMAGAKVAFLAGYAKGCEVQPPPKDDNAVMDRLSEEMSYIWNDEYTTRCMRNIGIDRRRQEELMQAFGRQLQASMETHGSLQLARKHFLNWVEKVKDKITYGTNKQQTADDWQDDILSRIARLTNGNLRPSGHEAGGEPMRSEIQELRGLP